MSVSPVILQYKEHSVKCKNEKCTIHKKKKILFFLSYLEELLGQDIFEAKSLARYYRDLGFNMDNTPT